jgi:predicted N-acyltransferase
MKLSTVSSLAEIAADDWNALTGGTNPFVQHDFLYALEKHDCLHSWGWQPAYQLVHNDNELIGATPSYIKNNSYGEFVFDWAWADAYQRHSMEYYPKLVTAIPYTPAKGPRLLAKSDNKQAIKTLLIRGALALVELEKLSSAHWLFCEEEDLEILKNENMLMRFDHQFHWSNNHYENFEHFLSQLSSKKRKNIRRERRKVSEENIQIQIKKGTELSEEEWNILYHFYCITFTIKSGTPTMTLDFFQAMAHKLVAFLAIHGNRIVAGAICFRDNTTLYGRHWGCYDNYDSLHFDVCYYTGIEYCINEGLQHFEPGAQGEHKISRGFLPVRTQSAHWIAHQGFRQAIADFLDHEDKALNEYGQILHDASPFKQTC